MIFVFFRNSILCNTLGSVNAWKVSEGSHLSHHNSKYNPVVKEPAQRGLDL